MKRLSVYYEGWGEHWLLGTLADNGKQLLFEYSGRALQEGLELSPHQLKLRAQAYGDFPSHLHRLPGFISDALPDGWGLMLMDKLFRKAGRQAAELSPLDRLAYIGDHAMGALSFEPIDPQAASAEQDMKLLKLAHEARTLINGEDSPALKHLARLGGSPHGARPKVLVYYDQKKHCINTQAFEGGTPWLVKFQAQGEHKEVCAIEHLYAQLAVQCGLNMPATAHFDLDKKLAAFGTQRFDRYAHMRVPTHTLAGLLHTDFRAVGAVDYTTLLRATRFVCKDERAVQEAFQRCVFNVIFNNRDDHAKNFSFRLKQERHWELAPAYDLTFNTGPGGEHQMDILGHGQYITRELLLKLADSAGLERSFARDTIDRMREQSCSFKAGACEHAIRRTTVTRIQQQIDSNTKLLA